MHIAHPRRLIAALALVLGVAAPASAQIPAYQLTPPYREGVTGARGWYRVPVTALFACGGPAQPLCPWWTGNQYGEGGRPQTNVFRNVVRPDALPVPVESAPGVPLRIDVTPPPMPALASPAVGTRSRPVVVDAGSAVTARYSCSFAGDESGPAPGGGACVGTVPQGALIDTGRADVPASWGERRFTVTATDDAGNRSSQATTYRIDELPGTPVAVAPADRQVVRRQPVLSWNAPADDGNGLDLYRVRITPDRQRTRTYEVADTSAVVSFTVPAALPLGGATWDVTFVDTRGRTATTAPLRFTVASRPPPAAPGAVVVPGPSLNAQPTFSWTPAEAGGTFTWEVAAGGQTVCGPAVVSTAAAQVTDALTPGDYVFRVRQTSDLGGDGAWSSDVPFTVLAPPPPPVALPAAATVAGVARPRFAPPGTAHARALRPRPGARFRLTRDRLHWGAARGATLYNVQVFRVVDGEYVKVLSSFPRGRYLRLPRSRVRPGGVYVWRVWPYIGIEGRYRHRPLGVSWFRA